MHTSALPQGIEPQLNTTPHTIRPTFGIACWLLAMLAFVQLITVGTALAVRSGNPHQVVPLPVATAPPVMGPIQARSIEQIIADAEHSSMGLAASGGQAHHDPIRVTPSADSSSSISPPPSGLQESAHAHAQILSVIANPRVERLVQESRNLHLEGDMMRAMLKLDEAARIDPSECAVIYQKGILFEDMGTLTRAADQYQQIQQMGLLKAGVYFNLAASKLTKGMDTASVRRTTIAIGPMKVNKGDGVDAGHHVEVAITLLARPDQMIQSDDVEVQVHFYDKVNGGKVEKAASNAHISPTWSDDKVDWRDAGNEETLRVSYTIPQANRADEHLLGRREFYGYVVELLYKGEVVDQQAYPRRLHCIHAEKMAPVHQDDLGMPWLPGEDDGLLPDKDQDDGRDAPLPSR